MDNEHRIEDGTELNLIEIEENLILPDGPVETCPVKTFLNEGEK